MSTVSNIAHATPAVPQDIDRSAHMVGHGERAIDPNNPPHTIDLSRVMQRMSGKLEEDLKQKYPDDTPEERASKLKLLMERIWNLMRKFMKVLGMRIGARVDAAGYEPDRAQTAQVSEAAARSEAAAAGKDGDAVSAAQAADNAAAALPTQIPGDILARAVDEEAHVFADHILRAGPQLTHLLDKGSSETYLHSSLAQLRKIMDGKASEAEVYRAEKIKIVSRIAIAEGATPELVERELQSNPGSMLDRAGEYHRINSSIRDTQLQQERCRLAMTATILAALDTADESGVDRARIKELGSFYEPQWEAIAQQARQAESSSVDETDDLVDTLEVAGDSRAARQDRALVDAEAANDPVGEGADRSAHTTLQTTPEVQPEAAEAPAPVQGVPAAHVRSAGASLDAGEAGLSRAQPPEGTLPAEQSPYEATRPRRMSPLEQMAQQNPRSQESMRSAGERSAPRPA